MPPEPALPDDPPLTEPARHAVAPAHAEPRRVVGLGASAGGMQALVRFFEHMPPGNGMAFVVVLHLSPSHESHAAEILQRATPMPVRQITEAVRIEPEHVYVLPPGHSLSMGDDGRLHLQDGGRVNGLNLAIDSFFRVLAQVRDGHSVGIVLSGTGNDGANGLARIKEQGGLTLAQLPQDAQHGGMPRAAIASGMVDFVLPVADMPARLMELAAHAGTMRLPRAVAPAPQTPHTLATLNDDEERAMEAALADIMATLRARTRHDFRHYKRPTVLRRLERRMQVTGTATLEAYRDHLHTHTEESAALLQDMLISVTNFFRDQEAFDLLARDVLPGLHQRLPADRPLRVWVAGCASGEEAYSLAMLLRETQGDAPGALPFQVFASDIDDRALAVARAGAYPLSIIGDIQPARLRSFFSAEQHQLRVIKSLRERVLFAHHNLLRDPPFSRVDLIVCRNLLIYLDGNAQAAVLNTFRFALNPGGFLFLGSSESADGTDSPFTALDTRHRIYRLRDSVPAPRLNTTVPYARSLPVILPMPSPEPPVRQHQSLARLHQAARDACAPPSVLIDGRHRILHMSADVPRFLQTQGGAPSHLLLNNVHPQLELALRTALLKARPVQQGEARVDANSEADMGDRRIRLTVKPVPEPADTATDNDLLLVTFDDIGQVVEAPADAAAGGVSEHMVRELQIECRRLQQQLQDVIEHSDGSTEELMSSNEELQALNEEMRSATEELETSREELQSTNEELSTVNSELALKVTETGRINDDLQNLINANDIATVFVDRGMDIKRFTPGATGLFNLIPADVGRSLLHITHTLDYPDLLKDAQTAFQSLRLVEREARSRDGRYFMARLLPYRTGDDKIDGAIISFIDVTMLRQSQQRVRVGAEQLRLAAESTRDFAILTTDDNGKITGWNRGAERLFGYTEQEALGALSAIIYTEEDRAAGLPERTLAAARDQGRSEDERWFQRKDGSVFYCSGVTTRLDESRGFAKIARDLTGSQESMQARELQLSAERAGRREAEAMMEAKEMFLAVMSHELKQPLNLIHLNAEVLARLPAIRAMPVAARAAGIIQQTVAGQARIIDDLLDLSRARTGKLSLDPAPLDWTDTVRRIVESLRPEAQAKGLSLHFEAGQQRAVSLFDPVRADQVVWNLLSNACKFTPRGGSVRIHVQANNGSARLTVTDTGKGIAPAFLDKVFEMFSQEGGAGGRQNEGMGIGMALVRELVQAHGGRVHVRSDGLGRGAEFIVLVPLHDGELASPAVAEPVSVLRGLKVLLVDDSAELVEALSTLLRLVGADIRTASTGQEVLDTLARAPVDLLISDITMPGMDGHALIRAVRLREQGGEHLLAIACSGYGRMQDEKSAIDAGFDALLSKPASVEQVERVVARLLQAAQMKAPKKTQPKEG